MSKKSSAYDLFNDDSLWGNQTAGGLSHEEIMDTNWNKKKSAAERARISAAVKEQWQDTDYRENKVEILRQAAIGREKTQEEIDQIHKTRKEKTLLAREQGEVYGDDKKKGKAFIIFTDDVKDRIAATKEKNQEQAAALGISYGSEKNIGRPNQGVSRALKGKKKSPETVAQQQATKARKRAEAEARGETYGPGKNKGKSKAPVSAETRAKQSAAKQGRKLSPESIIKREEAKRRNREAKLAAQALTNPDVMS